MSQNKPSQRISLTIVIALLVLALGILAVPIVICVRLKYSEPIEFKCGPLIEDPKIGFTEITDMEWPPNAEVITFADTHSGFLCDGEFYLIFKTDQEILEEWLSRTPPWEIDEWESGPVPPEIGSQASFGKGSDKIWYAAKERCCGRDSLYFHNGELLIINLETEQVWLSSWDY